jgi:predicted amidohydrolase YtcJ
VTRRSGGGDDIGLSEAVFVSNALDAYIDGGAYAMKHEAFRGRLVKGMAADFVVLDYNPFECAKENLPDIRARMTLKDGKIVYNSEP